MVTTRFAPSPTGNLHLGHAFAALVAHRLAAEKKGRFLLRFEDIDHTRVRPEFYQQIEDDLHWLGISWESPAWRQLDRLDSYREALARLKALDVVYPCFCTRREIEQELAHLTRAPHGPEGPLYPGTCRKLTSTQITDLSEHSEPAWRLNAQKAAQLAGPLTFHDLRHGTVTVDPTLLGDVILARKDIGTSYHLAVIVDDAAQEITHVTRGEDLLPSTHVHRVLQQILDLPEPAFLHHLLILDENGQRLAKRHDALSLASMRDHGSSPNEVLKRLEASLLPLS
ncbi:tRNA glutamyl-Q(34) synthetase GluQRS [Verrucomicrobiaceae bacterium 227]